MDSDMTPDMASGGQKRTVQKILEYISFFKSSLGTNQPPVTKQVALSLHWFNCWNKLKFA